MCGSFRNHFIFKIKSLEKPIKFNLKTEDFNNVFPPFSFSYESTRSSLPLYSLTPLSFCPWISHTSLFSRALRIPQLLPPFCTGRPRMLHIRASNSHQLAIVRVEFHTTKLTQYHLAAPPPRSPHRRSVRPILAPCRLLTLMHRLQDPSLSNHTPHAPPAVIIALENWYLTRHNCPQNSKNSLHVNCHVPPWPNQTVPIDTKSLQYLRIFGLNKYIYI